MGDTFFNVYFRPVLFVFYFIQYHLFDNNPYGYFVFIILLHAGIASLIFYGIARYTNYLFGLISGLFFAFHPTLLGWFGKIDSQHNHINLFLIMLTLLLLIKSIEQSSWKKYLLACFLYLCAILTREIFITLPLILFLGLNLLPIRQQYPWFKKLKNQLIWLSGIALTALFSIFLRFITYPRLVLSTGSSKSILFSCAMIKTKVIAVLQFFYDTFWLEWFPWKAYAFFNEHNLLLVYKCIKLLILVGILAFLVTNTKKKILLFFPLASLCLFWPFVVSYGGIRHFYESIPFFCAGLACLIYYSSLRKYKTVMLCVYGSLFTMLSINAYCVVTTMQNLRVLVQKATHPIEKLKETVKGALIDKPLFFFNAPTPLRAVGIIQATQLYKISTAAPQYFCYDLRIQTDEKNPAEIKNLIQIIKNNNSVRFITNDKEKLYFTYPLGKELPFLIKKVIGNEFVGDKIFDITLVFDERIFNQETIPLVWLFDQEEFVILEDL